MSAEWGIAASQRRSSTSVSIRFQRRARGHAVGHRQAGVEGGGSTQRVSQPRFHAPQGTGAIASRWPSTGWRESIATSHHRQFDVAKTLHVLEKGDFRIGSGAASLARNAACPERDVNRTLRRRSAIGSSRPGRDIRLSAALGSNALQTAHGVAEGSSAAATPDRRDRARPRAPRHPARTRCSPRRASRARRPPRSARWLLVRHGFPIATPGGSLTSASEARSRWGARKQTSTGWQMTPTCQSDGAAGLRTEG